MRIQTCTAGALSEIRIFQAGPERFAQNEHSLKQETNFKIQADAIQFGSRDITCARNHWVPAAPASVLTHLSARRRPLRAEIRSELPASLWHSLSLQALRLTSAWQCLPWTIGVKLASSISCLRVGESKVVSLEYISSKTILIPYSHLCLHQIQPFGLDST